MCRGRVSWFFFGNKGRFKVVHVSFLFIFGGVRRVLGVFPVKGIFCVTGGVVTFVIPSGFTYMTYFGGVVVVPTLNGSSVPTSLGTTFTGPTTGRVLTHRKVRRGVRVL